ncbi:S8 family serine peptidase [Gammaproteobacteria bacterium AB-CW1]|uniref:S8 family serine peptidase n=1 Tax=Natronospira elongata TaxID=3110268 RepID=A0AAP6JIW8_9GAMM|nr:S8 family serine peptidase [Gammaproteobacteria bacterium AB-CW1]
MRSKQRGLMDRMAVILGAVALVAVSAASQALAGPVEVRHFVGEEDREAIRAGWHTDKALYLVRLDDKPLALYRGGNPELAATSPAVRGQAGINLQSDASQSYLSHLDQQRDSFLDRLSEVLGREIEPVHVFRLANNGFTARMTPAEAEQLARVPGVRLVERDHQVELLTDAGPGWIGAPAIWDGSAVSGHAGSQGEGIVFAIIDTGIDPWNPSFAAQASDGYSHENPLGSGNFLGNCAGDDPAESMCNDKLIGMYGYPEIMGGSPVDIDGHGSHVAGTAAGNPVDVDFIGDEPTSIQGVAPRGNIISYNACCEISTLTQAMEDVVEDFDAILQVSPDTRMVMNYSIGLDAQISPWARFDSMGILSMREAGIFPAVAAGNSGPGDATIGVPALAPWAVAVANSTHDRIIQDPMPSVSGPGDVPDELQDLEAVPGDGPLVTGLDDKELIWAGDVDPGNERGCEAFAQGDFSGAIAVMERGDCVFSDKINHAADAGAVFVLMINNEPGELIVMGMEEPVSIPSMMISDVDGAAVVDWIQDHADPTMSVSEPGISHDPDEADRLNPSSSRGPVEVVPGRLGPDLAAPGTFILAPVAGDENQSVFGALTGTSMASPHVAGAAGLLMAVRPDWTAGEVKSALMLSAQPELLEFDGTEATPFGRGAGRVDLNRAANVGFVLDETAANFDAANPALGGNPGQLNLASFSTAGCDASCTLTRTLRGTAEGGSFEVIVEEPDGVTIDVEPSSFSIAEGETVELTVTFSDLDQAESTEGRIHFVSDNDGLDLQMPVVLGGFLAQVSGSVQDIPSDRPTTVVIFREDADGDLEEAGVQQFIGPGTAQFSFSLSPEPFYPAVAAFADGYDIAINDNNGQGFDLEPGEEVSDVSLSLVPMPFEIEAELESTTAGGGVINYEITTNGWAFTYELHAVDHDSGDRSLVTSGSVTDVAATELLELEATGLLCSRDYTLELTVSNSEVDAAPDQNEISLTTERCVPGSGGGGCSMSGADRSDPLLPALLLLALIGLAGRRRFG